LTRIKIKASLAARQVCMINHANTAQAYDGICQSKGQGLRPIKKIFVPKIYAPATRSLFNRP
jgi:hypothetical protein